MPKYSNYVRTRIELLHNQGLHPAGILKTLKGEGLVVSLSGITRMIKKLRLTGSVANLPCSGRPRKLSVEAKAFIDQQMRKDDEMTSAKIQKSCQSVKFPWVHPRYGDRESSKAGLCSGPPIASWFVTPTKSSGWSLRNTFWRVETLSTTWFLAMSVRFPSSRIAVHASAHQAKAETEAPAQSSCLGRD